MKYFCVPSDFKTETIDQFDKLNQQYEDCKIHETYGNITLGVNYGSGRVLDQIPKVSLIDLQKYVDYANKSGIDFNYTFNSSYMDNKEFTEKGVKSILQFLCQLKDMGINSLTVALPSMMTLLQESNLGFKVKASAICHITNAHKAMTYKKLGAERIVVDESIHRNFNELRNIIKVFGDGVEVIVNTMCHTNCIYRQFHYNETTGDSRVRSNKIGVNYFEHRCLLQRYKDYTELLKLGWIRPEDIDVYYKTGIKYYKLQGRQHVEHGDQIKTIVSYFEKKYDGNLMNLLDMFNPRYSFPVNIDNNELDGFIDAFVENDFCKRDCAKCGYCEKYAVKCINREDFEKISGLAKKFYSECDMFSQLISRVEKYISNEEHIQSDKDFTF